MIDKSATEVSAASEVQTSKDSKEFRESMAQLLRHNIDAVLNEPEILAELETAPISQAELARQTKRSAEQIGSIVSKERSKYEQLRGRSLDDIRLGAAETKKAKSDFLYTATFVFVGILALAVLTVLVNLVFNAVLRSWDPWRDWGSSVLGVAVISLIGGVASFAAALVVEDKEAKAIQERKRNALRTAHELAKSEYGEALRQEVRAQVRRAINKSRAPSFSHSLQFKHSRGLTELYDDVYRVRTPAYDNLDYLLDQLAGGTIGVSGPRGVGKTTLISHYCTQLPANGENENFSVLVSAPVDYDALDFLLHLFASVCRNYLKIHQRHGQSIGNSEDNSGKKKNGLFSRLFRRSLLRKSEHSGEEVVETSLEAEAHGILKQIEFTQTHTSSISGKASVKLVEALAQTQTSRTRATWTRPEAADELRGFLRRISLEMSGTPGRVLIGIDELDKIHAAEQAHKFINDLKAILGLPECYFLVAVSQDALASYELRGLPLRDAFDSAFDEVVEVKQLQLSDARELLARRLIGIPEPFVCLAHCLSGGLPRDLLRIMRKVLQLSDRNAPGKRRLGEIAEAFVKDSIINRASGLTYRLSSVTSYSPVSQLLHEVDAWGREGLDSRSLYQLGLSFQGVIDGVPPSKGSDGEPTHGMRDAKRTIASFGGYLCCCAAILAFFDESLTEEKLRTASESGDASVDSLAIAMSTLAVDYHRSMLLVHDFCTKWELGCVDGRVSANFGSNDSDNSN